MLDRRFHRFVNHIAKVENHLLGNGDDVIANTNS